MTVQELMKILVALPYDTPVVVRQVGAPPEESYTVESVGVSLGATEDAEIVLFYRVGP